jgi:hypothetical protein
MNYESFLNKVSKIVSINKNYTEESQPTYSKKKNTIPGKLAIVSPTWVTGGVSGGSCWDTEESRHYPVDGEPEEDLNDLDRILQYFCPNLGFLTYKEICSKLIRRKEWTVYEYYGNSTNEAEKYVYLEDLYNELKSRNLI